MLKGLKRGLIGKRFILALVVLGCAAQDNIKRHWIEIPDRYHGTSVCVLDSTEQIVGYAKEAYPNLEPGIYYAEDGKEIEWGRFGSKILAKREVERRLGGCPGYRLIVENRRLFVGKHVYNAFAGYAHAQLEKMETRDSAELREYLAVTAEAKHRGIHPNTKGELVPYPDGHDTTHGEAATASCMGNEKLTKPYRSFSKEG